MNMAIGIEEYIIGLDIPVDNALSVNISQCTAQLSDPEPDGILCKCFS